MGLKDLINSKCVFEKVQWCIIPTYRCMSLLDHIRTAGNYVDEKYRLYKENDLLIVQRILEIYKQNLIEKYFYQTLSTQKAFVRMECEEYFFYTLLCFLEKHETNVDFDNQEMYKLISRTNYGMYGRQLYDAKYSLTHYGIVYNKLSYIVSNYCSQNAYIQNNLKFYDKSELIKKRIDERRITISVM